ncbi:Protein ELC [Linum perenne]
MSTSPAIQQFLSSVLSQRGPSAVPYSEDTKWLIRQQLLSLATAYPSLEPKTAMFTHNDGRSVNLLQAEGTIPMVFKGVTYNIPIIIWLMDSYPRYPPRVFVNPTRDMVIKRPHAHVNPSGSVSVPYLQNWIYPSSNLLDLVRELSDVFGRDPPLYSQRRLSSNPNPNPNPNPNLTPSHSPSFSSNPSNLSNSSSFGSISGPYQRPMVRPYPPSPYGSGNAIPARPQQTDDAAEVFRRNAINKIVEMTHGDISQLRKTREAEMEGIFSAQAVLRSREEEVNRGLKELQDEKEGLETQLQVVLMNSDVLEGWVRENEGKVKGNNLNHGDAVDVDGAFECVDLMSKQMLECSAADLAIEDVVYALDKAVQEGAMPFDQYLRNVRFLSREQFFHRATGTKVRAMQMQSQVASMAARIQQFTS